MSGASRRNFRVFRELCGEESLKNVVITTNMWSNPPTEIELKREEELHESENCYQPILSKGARTARYIRGAGVNDARKIIRMFLANQALPLRLQQEQTEGLPLDQTAAGRALREELVELAGEQEREIAGVQADMEREYAMRDSAARKELEDYKQLVKKQQASIQAQLDRLTNELMNERERREQLERTVAERAQPVPSTGWFGWWPFGRR